MTKSVRRYKKTGIYAQRLKRVETPVAEQVSVPEPSIRQTFDVSYTLHEVREACVLLERVVNYESYSARNDSVCLTALGIPRELAGKLRTLPRGTRVHVTLGVEVQSVEST